MHSAFSTCPPPCLQLEHTTLPAREHGNKQLGQRHAAGHLLQLMVMFGLGIGLFCLPTPAPGQARVVMATYGVTYALQVGVRHLSAVICCVLLPATAIVLLGLACARLLRQQGLLQASLASPPVPGACPHVHILGSQPTPCLSAVPAMPAVQATKLIMAHMAKEPFEVTLWPLVALALQVGGRSRSGACGYLLPRRCLLPASAATPATATVQFCQK
jgi:hypothetical protein